MFSKTLIKTYNPSTKLKKNFKYDRLTSLTKEEKLKLSLHEIKFKLMQLKKISRDVPKYVYKTNFTKVHYCILIVCANCIFNNF